jgi:hypothetical protein
MNPKLRHAKALLLRKTHADNVHVYKTKEGVVFCPTSGEDMQCYFLSKDNALGLAKVLVEASK